MPVTFAVSDVDVGPRLREQPTTVAEAVHQLVGAKTATGSEGYVATSTPVRPFYPGEFHPFVAAVDTAFRYHLPLALSPDHVWLLLTQGFAQHVVRNAESLRDQFVPHDQQATIQVHRDDLQQLPPDAPWDEVIDEIAAEIRKHIGKRRDLIVANFSTTGPLERIVSQVSLMEAVSPYFEYLVVTLCGIPSITLTGCQRDWQSIRERAWALGDFGLKTWVDALVPILDHFVQAFDGQVDQDFWRSIYKRNEESGGPYISGWLPVFLPDLQPRIRSPYGNDVLREITSADFPSGLNRVEFIWRVGEHRSASTEYPMELLSGFVGIEQDPSSLAVQPALGWCVRDAPTSTRVSPRCRPFESR